MGRISGKHLSDAERDKIKAEVRRQWALGLTPTHAAKILGIRAQTVRDIAREMKEEENRVEFPEFVINGDEEDEPIEEIIDRMAKNYERAKRAQDARRWFSIKVKDAKPIGVLFFGDPHVDDNGCAWPILKEHVDICRSTPGLHAVNIGDSANWWGGRLLKKYADQDTSVNTARRLVEWLLVDSGVSWLVWLHGNHEHMGNAVPLMHQMNRAYGTQQVPMLDWEARFTLDFPNGAQFRINAAHDFPGNSMWNPVHGVVKAAKFGNDIDVLVCGHKHNWAVSQWEQSEQGNAPLMIRVRGYKHNDDYARRIGKYDQEEGQSILVIFDPNSKSQAGRVQAFVDIRKGAAVLTALRGEELALSA